VLLLRPHGDGVRRGRHYAIREVAVVR
jgi:hypothetical protein